jgi:8-oxo-dGTP pyrophosphatase MutT (NUDIX family)
LTEFAHSEELAAIERRLVAALRTPLPGAAARAWMAPAPRPGWDPQARSPAGRPAAVLLLLYPDAANAPTLLLTERTERVERHKRQVSFPGGGIEPGETAQQAALREAFEETAVPLDVPRVLGALTPLWVPATGFTIHPFVAVAPRRPPLRPNPHEVSRVIEVRLAQLMDADAARVKASMSGGRWVRVPYFDVEGAMLWGASAMITSELLALLGWPGPVFTRAES